MLKFDDLQKVSTQLGIDKIGVSPATTIDGDALNEWLNRGYAGKMSYMERNKDKRLDPDALLPGAQSVISIFINYHQEEIYPTLDGVISKYARGIDYHIVLKPLLHDLADALFGDLLNGLSRKERAKTYRVFVDSAPVMEKHWAVQAGIGWQGKHSNIITRELGSWGFLGEIICTEAFDQYSVSIPDYCGECTACIDACPTSAIVEPYVVDGSKCIAYATIEIPSDQPIPDKLQADMERWIFGCDICQDVCPWNRFSKPSDISEFVPIDILKGDSIPLFQDMSESEFDRLFKSTPLARSGLIGLRRNQKIRDLSPRLIAPGNLHQPRRS
ncbi:MAG: tRNA epoxyqueuosine(34) reductase QueG [Candidatus Marinimicrobia bacterium]|nr:tRNA epoxyqueuosine(34) reductase QueG [Candidatus Neomarinimicrobiota bacterium]